MRMYLRRIGIVAAGGFALTLMLTALPHHTGTDESAEPEPRARPYRKGSTPAPAKFPKAEDPVDHFSLRNLRKQTDGQPDAGKKWWPQLPFNDLPPDDPRDIPAVLPKLEQDRSIVSLRGYLEKWDGRENEDCPTPDTFGAYYYRKYKKKLPRQDNMDKFFSNIGSCDMYREHDDGLIAGVIRDLQNLPIEHVEILGGGTQVKLMLLFEGGKQAAFKPMRFSREYETDPNHFYFSDFERHNAEIAAFHLDRILGIRNAIPTTGRVFNLSSEIQQRAEHALNKTFFVSPFKNLCFVSKCDYYCDTTHAICGLPHMKEGSVQVFLPDEDDAPRDHAKSPYRRTYSKKRQVADWQKDDGYCDAEVKTKKAFAHGRKLINLVEMHIFDFLTGNQDRHHFEGFDFFEGDPYPIFFDNGRAFGRPHWDDLDILRPLSQCCLIRPRLLKRLLGFYTGPESLAQALSASMATEPVAPILAAKHYPALQRRLVHILTTVKKCIGYHLTPQPVLPASSGLGS